MDKESFKDHVRKIDIDYFISSASFEDRCLSVCSTIHDLSIKQAIIFATIDFHDKIKEKREKLIELCSHIDTKSIDLKISDPTYSFLNMSNVCNEIFKNKPVIILIDITTFTHEGLLMLFRLIYNAKTETDSIYITYVGAKSYSLNELGDKNKWLTKGTKDVRSIIGYPGYFDPSRKSHLIIFVGFEKERTVKLIEEFDFDVVTLAFGSKSDSISDNHQRLNKNKHQEIIELYSSAKTLEISLTDPQILKKQISDYLSDYSNYNIVIAPMNNKISTIGAGLIAIENQEIQLFYMQANIYNMAYYSEPGDDYYLIKL